MTVTTHACFLLIAVLCVLFVRAPAIARIFLLLLVVGNVVGELRFKASFSFYTLATLEAAIIIGMSTTTLHITQDLRV